MFNQSFDWMQARYVGTVGVIIKRSVMAMAIFLILIVTILGLFRTIPGSFLPEEDQGYFITIIQLPDGASMTRTIDVLNKVESYFRASAVSTRAISVPASERRDWSRSATLSPTW